MVFTIEEQPQNLVAYFQGHKNGMYAVLLFLWNRFKLVFATS